MTTLTPPRANIPIGWAMVGGSRVAVAIEPEWLRYLAGSLFDRGGGTSGVGTDDLAASAFEDAGIPEMEAAVYRVDSNAGQNPPIALLSFDNAEVSPEIAILRAEIDALRTRVAALEQGVVQ